jgi:putative ABC transport system permease protein
VATLDLRRTGVPDAQVAALHRRILERLQALPDTTAAGTADRTPLSHSFWNETLVLGGVIQQDFPWVNRVGAGYFGTLGIPFVAGRNFDDRDTLAAPPVAVVTEAFVEKYFGGTVPLGRAFRFAVGPGEPNPSYEIVGVVRNIKYSDLRDPFDPIIFLASAQDPEPGRMTVLLRGRRDAGSLVAPVTQAVAAIDPRILIDFRLLDVQIRDTLVRERLMAGLSVFFAALAVLLAAIGLYGVMSYTVARRKTEIGIRLALGASPGWIARLIVRETAWLVVVGSVIGLALAVGASRAAASLLFGVTPGDTATLAVALATLAAVALAASLWPARRAARLDPTTALREP